MSFKTFLAKIFGVNKDTSGDYVYGNKIKVFNSTPVEYSSYTGDLYANSLVRRIVHRIASYGSLISFNHVRGYGDNFEYLKSSRLNKLLCVKPNEYMTPSDLTYKIWTDLLLTNNSYQWLKRDKDGSILEIFPIIANSVEVKQIENFLFYKFYFDKGETLVVPFSDVVHNKTHFYRNNIFGEENDALREDVGLVDTMNVSVDAALKNGAQIKGILKHQNTIDADDLEKQSELFKSSYLNPKNSGGIGVIDAKFDFIPINYTGKVIDKEQMQEIKENVFEYFGVNSEILQSKYISDSWQSYYEGVMMPIINNMAQNYNTHCFTERELNLGNRVLPSVNHVTFMSSQQKIAMVKLALDGALYTRNEIREWFGDSPIEGGNTFQYSKNFTEDVTVNKGGKNGATDTVDDANDVSTGEQE